MQYKKFSDYSWSTRLTSAEEHCIMWYPNGDTASHHAVDFYKFHICSINYSFLQYMMVMYITYRHLLLSLFQRDYYAMQFLCISLLYCLLLTPQWIDLLSLTETIGLTPTVIDICTDQDFSPGWEEIQQKHSISGMGTYEKIWHGIDMVLEM